MHLRGVLRYFIVLGTWMVGAFFIPAALICHFAGWGHTPLLILCIYYPLRYFFPATPWDGWINVMCLNEDPYFNTQCVVMDEGAVPPKPKSKTLITVAPHGILTLGWNSVVSSKEFVPCKVRWLIADILAYLPFISDLCRWSNMWGCTPANMHRFMAQGENIALIPGGFQEATLYMHGRHRLYIRNRAGFVKYALQYGYSIQPCYVFGEEWSYWQIALYGAKSFALWLNRFHVPGTVFVGRFLFFPDPDLDLVTVVGAPIQLPHIPNPTANDINHWHHVYIQTVTSLFDRYKYRYNIHRYRAEVEEVVVGTDGQGGGATVVAVTDSSEGSGTGSLSRSSSSAELLAAAAAAAATAGGSGGRRGRSGSGTMSTTGAGTNSSIDELSSVGGTGIATTGPGEATPARRSSRTQANTSQADKDKAKPPTARPRLQLSGKMSGVRYEYRAKLPPIRLEIL